MKTAPHTAGPWHVFCVGRTLEVQDAQGQPVIAWTGFDRSEIPFAVHRANATMAAASPALLQALRETSTMLRAACLVISDRTARGIALAQLEENDRTMLQAEGRAV